jgi:hypothetical protein
MSQLSINGVELSLPLSPDALFQDLILYLRKNLPSETVLISSLKVNGNDVSESDEQTLAQIPIAELQSVEVFTRHPKELAQEILKDTLDFTLVLVGLSEKTAENLGKPDFYPYLTRLVDGIGYFTDAITQAKKVLKVEAFQVTDVLEADLLMTLKRLLQLQQQGQQVQMPDLLRQHLQPNFAQWRSVGIPALMRSRDC